MSIDTPIPQPPPRSPLTTHLIRSLIDAANRIRRAAGDGKYVTADIVQGTLRVRWIGPTIFRTQQFSVVAEYDDYVTAHPLVGDQIDTAKTVLIAKPPALRKTTYNGTTNDLGWLFTYVDSHTRTASKSGETDITETIRDPYTAGDIIYADMPAGGTHVTNGDDDLIWCDTNRDARRWSFSCD